MVASAVTRQSGRYCSGSMAASSVAAASTVSVSSAGVPLASARWAPVAVLTRLRLSGTVAGSVRVAAVAPTGPGVSVALYSVPAYAAVAASAPLRRHRPPALRTSSRSPPRLRPPASSLHEKSRSHSSGRTLTGPSASSASVPPPRTPVRSTTMPVNGPTASVMAPPGPPPPWGVRLSAPSPLTGSPAASPTSVSASPSPVATPLSRSGSGFTSVTSTRPDSAAAAAPGGAPPATPCRSRAMEPSAPTAPNPRARASASTSSVPVADHAPSANE